MLNSMQLRLQSVRGFYADPAYFKTLRGLLIPLFFQNVMYASLNMVANVLVGQYGDVAVAAVGLAGQIFFLLNLIVFGISSGMAILMAQLWGKRDVPNIRRVLGLSIMLTIAASLIFVSLSTLIPEKLLGLYSQDAQVILAGAAYLRIFSLSFIFFAVTFSFATALRSVGEVRLPVTVSITTLVLNIILTYGLLLGRLGLPEMGLMGAALALVISRSLECIVLLVIVYRRGGPVAASLSEMMRPSWDFIKRVFEPVLPVIATEILWALGTTTYNAIYAHIGTESIAAMNILAMLDNLVMAPFMSLTGATAVMIGNRIGAGEEDRAFVYGLRTLGLGVAGAVLMGMIILLGRDAVLSLYRISPEAFQLGHRALMVHGLFLWVRVSNLVIIIAAFRSGGDTRFSLFLDGTIIWMIGVPLAALGAFVLGLPVFFVYLMAMGEEVTKCSISLWRFFSRRWIHNLAQVV